MRGEGRGARRESGEEAEAIEGLSTGMKEKDLGVLRPSTKSFGFWIVHNFDIIANFLLVDNVLLVKIVVALAAVFAAALLIVSILPP